jgi:acyl carrier protein
MEPEAIAGKLKDIIIQIKNNELNADAIQETTNLITGLGIDSLQLINLILSIEDEFELEIDFDNFDLSHLNQFNLLCRFVSDCVDKKSAEAAQNEALFCKLTNN